MVVVMVTELDRLREVALALPEINERISHGSPCFFIRDRKPLCYFHGRDGSDGRVSLWCPAPPGVAREMAETEPERFYKPTPSASGVFGDWLGMYLDTVDGDSNQPSVDWDEVGAVLETAFRHVAPKGLLAEIS